MRTSQQTSNNDRGFSLVEMVISVSIMGLVAVSLGLIVSVVLRTAPSADGRIDDARSLLGLTTYMPEDVNSTPAGNFNLDQSAAQVCSSSGTNILTMEWYEDIGTPITYWASYRYVDDGSGYRIIRYACDSTDPALANVRPMSAELPPPDPITSDIPVTVTNKHVNDDVLLPVKGVTVSIDTIAGDTLNFEMRSNNLSESLPPPVINVVTNNGLPNEAPIVQDITVDAIPNIPIEIGLLASDGNGDGLLISITEVGVPNPWSYTQSGLTMTLDPQPAFVNDVGIYEYTATDASGTFDTGTITVNIVGLSTPNTPPTANDVTLTVDQGASTVINLPVTDADNNPLTVVLDGPADPSLDVTVIGTDLIVVSDGTTTTPAAIGYYVSDGIAVSPTAYINLTVIQCQVTGLTPMASSVVRNPNKRLDNNVEYTVAYTGPCYNLVLGYDNDLSDGSQEVFLSFGTGFTVTLQGHPGGANWTLGNHNMTLRNGYLGTPIHTAILTVT
jgi:prepilin-type N-terminal cleavage/methylation domain-containing protein